MSQNILLVDYEPRTVARVTEALGPAGYQVLVAKDVDGAVAACAKTEPRLVLITSVLPRIKVEDAITQMRALAGLRATPFVVLMSGYSGEAAEADAKKLGANAIIAKPFSNEELVAGVESVLARSRSGSVSPDTRADVLDALRKSAGLAGEVGTVTSEELFGDLGDLIETESPAKTQRIQIPKAPPVAEPQAAPEPAPSAPAPPAARVQADAPPTRPKPIIDTAVDRALESTLADIREKPGRPKPREDTGGASVDELLSQTLSGLQIQRAKPAARPTEPVVEPPAPSVPVAAPAPAPEPKVQAQPAPPAPAPAPVVSARTEVAKAEQAPLVGGTPFGQYELMEPIATGGMAEVYKARMRGVEGFQKIVAIKRILPHLTDNDEFVTMFIDEAKLAAQLQHPNIIHIYDLGKIERSYYIAMEYIDGKDLRSILRTLEEKGRRITLGPALYIARRLAAALDYAHRKKDMSGRAMALVHRDVSPQNVLISFDGDIKLCDFGIAKAASKASHTRAGALKGKLQYMSPEQAWGKDIDHRSDIFSLGLVLYEMVTGRKAFAGDSELSILEQVRAPRLVLPREVDASIPPEVEQVIIKALKENRDERYQTAAEMETDLDEVLQSLRPVPGPVELGQFLGELAGKERPSAAAAERPTTPAPKPAARPAAPPQPAAAPVAVPVPAAATPSPAPAAEVSEVIAPSRRGPAIPLVAGLAVVVVAAVLLAIFMTRGRAGGVETAADQAIEAATPAPAADTAQLSAGDLAPAEPAANQLEQPTETQVEGEAAPAVVPTRPAPTPRPRPTEAAAVAPPPVVPTTEPAVQTAPEPEPTAAPVPTPVPTVAPTPEPTRAPSAPTPPPIREGQEVAPTTPGLVMPQTVFSPPPEFPRLALRQRVSGYVILSVLVDHTGAVEDVKVLRGIKPDLGCDAAAAAAVRGWRFKPATINGVKVKVWLTQTIPFISS